jgi:hypothetical protein
MTRLSLSLLPAFGSLLLLIGASCSKTNELPTKPTGPADGGTEITAEINKGQGIDLVFVIKQQTLAPDGSRTLEARGTYNGMEVGLLVVLGAKWESVAPDPKQKFAFHTGTVEYRTVGAPSNTLLEVIDDLYATGMHPLGLRAVTKFAGTSIEGDPADLVKGEVRIKLQFEAAEPEKQAELYTKIDLPNHVLRICEKDPSYRKALVQALSQE